MWHRNKGTGSWSWQTKKNIHVPRTNCIFLLTKSVHLYTKREELSSLHSFHSQLISFSIHPAIRFLFDLYPIRLNGELLNVSSLVNFPHGKRLKERIDHPYTQSAISQQTTRKRRETEVKMRKKMKDEMSSPHNLLLGWMIVARFIPSHH